MDITNEASVDQFSIGPSTFLGAQSPSASSSASPSLLLHQILLSLSLHFSKLKNSLKSHLSPLLSWLHPRNPQSILLIITAIAFLLKRFTNVRDKAEMAYKWARSALTYDEWAHAAKMLERDNPRPHDSDLYDELSRRRRDCSIRLIMFYMRADLIRNLGNMF